MREARKFEQIPTIQSAKNSQFKEWFKLTRTSMRKKTGYLLIEGLRQIQTALGADVEPLVLIFADDDAGARLFEQWSCSESGTQQKVQIPKQRLQTDLFKRLSAVNEPQGMILVCSKPRLIALADWLAERPNEIGHPNCTNTDQSKIVTRHSDGPILSGAENGSGRGSKLVLLDCLSDPGNLGTVIRTADALGFDAIILLKGSVDPFNAKVMRSAMGSLFARPLLLCESGEEAVKLLRQSDYRLTAADLHGIPLPQWKASEYGDKHVLVIGNEAHGISTSLIDSVDECVTIPMEGSAESLNAAIAFAIMAYHLMHS